MIFHHNSYQKLTTDNTNIATEYPYFKSLIAHLSPSNHLITMPIGNTTLIILNLGSTRAKKYNNTKLHQLHFPVTKHNYYAIFQLFTITLNYILATPYWYLKMTFINLRYP